MLTLTLALSGSDTGYTFAVPEEYMHELRAGMERSSKTGLEEGWCMGGSVEGRRIDVTWLKQPPFTSTILYSWTRDYIPQRQHLMWQTCPEGTLIQIHTHPHDFSGKWKSVFGAHRPSPQDKELWNKLARPFFGIVYWDEKFKVPALIIYTKCNNGVYAVDIRDNRGYSRTDSGIRTWTPSNEHPAKGC